MTLGQRISQYRKAMGISQEMLGERLGVSRQAVSKWETDTAVPDMENLLALAREFGISVAELTATPDTPSRASRKLSPFLFPSMLFLAIVCMGLIAWGSNFFSDSTASAQESTDPPHSVPPESSSDDRPTPPSSEVSVPVPAPETDFALLWYGSNGDEEFLELGVQEAFFPFGTTLELTAPEVVLDTDFHLTDLHQTVCGAINLEYLHSQEDLEYDPNSPTRESILRLSTIASSVQTPRGIHVGSTKAQVTDAYGDELVYCLKEQDGYTLVQHDYYYIYQPDKAFSKYLAIYMRDGLVAGLLIEDLIDAGNDFFEPDNIHIFPVVNGEPNFSQRQEPEQEERSDTWKIYHAWNQLVTNNNLSAEELYAYRRDVFGLLPYIDWGEFREWSAAYDDPDAGIFAIMSWMANQDSYSSSEILWLQMSSRAKGLDGAYADSYTHVLSRALFYDPVTFAKNLASDSMDDELKWHTIINSAYDAIWYKAECSQAVETLEHALADGTFANAEVGWCRLLLLYLSTEAEDGSFDGLPKNPADMQ